MSQHLTTTDILGATFDRCPLKVPIPERDGHVFVCRITASEREVWEGEYVGTDDKDPNTRGSFAWLTLCDEAGVQQFAEDKRQIASFANMDCAFITRVFKAAYDHNGMDIEFDKKTAKNSEKTTPPDSGSS